MLQSITQEFEGSNPSLVGIFCANKKFIWATAPSELNCPACRSRTICPTIVNLFKQLYFACTSAYIHSLQFLVMARAERRHTNDRACLRSACLHIFDRTCLRSACLHIFDRACLRSAIFLFRPHITCFELAVIVCAERN